MSGYAFKTLNVISNTDPVKLKNVVVLLLCILIFSVLVEVVILATEIIGKQSLISICIFLSLKYFNPLVYFSV